MDQHNSENTMKLSKMSKNVKKYENLMIVSYDFCQVLPTCFSKFVHIWL